MSLAPSTQKSDQSHFVARNPWLRIIPANDIGSSTNPNNCVVRDLYHRSNYEIDNRLVEVLFSLPSNVEREDIISKLSDKCNLSTEESSGIVASFEENKILLDYQHPSLELFEKTKPWKDFGWSAAQDYNAATYNFDYLSGNFQDRNKDRDLMRKYHEESPPPSPYKRMQGIRTIQLEGMPKSIASGSLHDALVPDLEQVNVEKLTAEELSALCFLPFGKTGTITFHNQGDFLLKCVPSGGARHPIECYVVSFDNEIPDGLYHYNVEQHSLVGIKDNVTASDLNDSRIQL